MMNKESCIIASGDWGGNHVLFKNRDRNYLAPIKVYHEILNGVEVLYYKDELTGWLEGINEFGIGIVNAALSVTEDEKEGHIAILNKDPLKMLEALQCDNIDDAVNIICNKKITGHTFISDDIETISIELDKEFGCIVRKLRANSVHVRTNHGIHFESAGYQEGIGRDSSLTRRNRAIKKLKEIDEVEDIAPSIYGYRVGKDPYDPLNMVRDTKDKVQMRTTSQVVYDLPHKKMYLYLIPRKVKFLGYQKDPNLKYPRCSISIIKYTGIKEDGSFDMDVLDLDKYGIKEYTRPNNKLASIRTAMLKKDIIKGLNSDVKKKSSPLKPEGTLNKKGKSQFKIGDETVNIEIDTDDNIYLNCTCGFWTYQGCEYHAKKDGYLLGNPKGTATEPKEKDPEGKNRLCKHTYAVLDKIVGK